jgi:subtilisin family serine protease
MSKLLATHEYFKKPPEFRAAPVKIAVFDTGVDSKHPFIRGAILKRRIKVRKSFVVDDESTEDESGHGTHVAGLLLTVAPDAQLYVAKIANTEEIQSNHKIVQVRSSHV